MRATTLATIAGALAAGSLVAQHDERHHVSPYADAGSTEVPSLTQQEIDDLRNGAGMGLARPAELNHFPGPKHTLEMAMDLGLTDDQRRAIEGIRERMAGAAVELGERIIEAEGALNDRFLHEHIDESTLERMVADVSRLSGELRFVHLRAHLETTAVLSAEQIAAYDRMRGYDERRHR